MIQPEQKSSESPRATADRRRNFAILFANNSIFWIGFSLISPVTILPLFVSHLTNSNLLVGAVPTIVQLSWALPQLLGPGYFERRRIKKYAVSFVNISGRVLFMAYGGMVVALAQSHPGLVLVLFFVFVFLFRGSSGFTSTGWVDILGKVVRPGERGRFLGLSQAAGGLLGAFGVWLAARVIGEDAFPAGFGVSMVLAGGILALTPVLLIFVKEPPSMITFSGLRPPWKAAQELPALFRTHPRFFRYVVGRLMLGWAMTAFSFLSVYAARVLGATDADVSRFTAVLLAAQTVSNVVWGLVNDRVGSRYIPVFGGAAALAATALAAMTPSTGVLFGVFVFVGASLGAFMVSDLSVLLDMAPEDRRPSFMAVYNVSTAPLLLLAPLAAGLLVDLSGFRTMFVAAVALALMGSLAIWRVAHGSRPAKAAIDRLQR